MKHWIIKCGVCVVLVMLSHVVLSQEDIDLSPSTELSAARANLKVEVHGLFSKMALVSINGRQQTLKDGQKSIEGVLLMSANSKRAIISINGEQQTLFLSRGVSSGSEELPISELRLSSSHNGHFFGSATINGRRAQFVVDTGASSVVINSITAKELGLKYEKGASVRVSTAQGTTVGHQIFLTNVKVGGISAKQVGAIVLEGEFPVDILLGNTFLSQFDMNVDSGVLLLSAKY
ncbi:MAG: aspartyl protease family protein [Flavobacteriales bacterium]